MCFLESIQRFAYRVFEDDYFLGDEFLRKNAKRFEIIMKDGHTTNSSWCKSNILSTKETIATECVEAKLVVMITTLLQYLSSDSFETFVSTQLIAVFSVSSYSKLQRGRKSQIYDVKSIVRWASNSFDLLP